MDEERIIGEVAADLLGAPTFRVRDGAPEIRYGTHGSLKINLNAGTWYDHEEKAGGGLFDFVKRYGNEIESIPDYLKSFGWISANNGEDRAPTLRAVSRIVESYAYQDVNGTTIFVVDRLEPKSFRQRQPDGKGGWINNIRDIDSKIPYHLPQLRRSETVFIVEGEKDVHALETIGLVATTCAGGAGKWTDEHSHYLDDQDVFIIPDNDNAGRRHAEIIQNSIPGAHILHLPDVPPKGDVSDWLSLGGSAEALLELARVGTEPPLHGTYYGLGALDREPSPDWLRKGLIPEKSFVVTYGGSMSGKTFIALDMALSIAHGVDYQDMATGEGYVIYVAAEGSANLKKRSGSWHEAKGLTPSDSTRMMIRPVGVSLDDPEAIDHFISDVRQITKGAPVQLIVLDTLARMFNMDENSSKDMSVAINACDRIKRAFQCAVMPVHHTGKDTSRGARGSNALICAADVMLRVEQIAGYVTMTTEKQKDEDPLEDIFFKKRKVSRLRTPFGEPEVSLVFERQTSGGGPRAYRLSNAQRIAFETLQAALSKYSEKISGVRELAVKRNLWRDEAVARDISSGTADAARKAFDRAAGELQKKNLVDIKDGYCFYIKKRNDQAD